MMMPEKKLTDELSQHLPFDKITCEKLDELKYVDQFVKEIKRFYGGHAVPMTFGKSKSFHHEGMYVSEGWNVLACFYAVAYSPKVYTNPEKFDPDRYSDARAEDKRVSCTYVPQGKQPALTNHGCAGFDLVHVIMKLVLIQLLSGSKYKWALSSHQNLEPKWHSIPALPVDGVVVESFSLC